MITAGGRAAFFILIGQALLPSATVSAQVDPGSIARPHPVEPRPIRSPTATNEPKPGDNRAGFAAKDDATEQPDPDSQGALRPIHEADVPLTGLSDLLAGMAIGGAVVWVVWVVIHWLRRTQRTRFRSDRPEHGSTASSAIDADQTRRRAARTELLARLEIAEVGPASDPPSSETQTDPDVPLDQSRTATTAHERAALLGEASQAGAQDGNGTGWTGRAPVDQATHSATSLGLLLEHWDHAFRQGDLDACRRAMTGLAGRIETTTAEHLREEVERMSLDLEASLRERFSACVRDLDYRGAVAVGSHIKRQLPGSSIAADYDRIHPYLLRRIEQTPT